MAEYRKISGFPYSVSDNGTVRNDRTGNFVKPDCGAKMDGEKNEAN